MQDRNQKLEQEPAKTSNEIRHEAQPAEQIDPSNGRLGATYSPEDNKLRLYSVGRLDAETYQQVKAAGFSWAPKQQLFVAPMWTPAREDLLLSLCGWIDAEEISLAERAAERVERFGEYRASRAAEASAAQKAVAEIAKQFEGGQPVILGHHSTRRGLRAKEKIDAGMRKAVNLWDTADYWKYRAAGARRHAEYKALPAVRARRIKKLQSDARRQERYKQEQADRIALWSGDLTAEQAARLADAGFGLSLRVDGDRVMASPLLRDGTLSVEEVTARVLGGARASIAYCERWLTHYANRLAYETAMLGETGGLPADAFTIEVGGKVAAYSEWLTVLRLNRRDGQILSVTTEAPVRFSYQQRLTIPYERITQYMPPTPESKATAKIPPLVNHISQGCVQMTKAEYSELWSGYKGTRKQAATTAHGAYRYRVAVRAGRLLPVYLTDAKQVDPPAPLPAPKAAGSALSDGVSVAAVALPVAPRETAQPQRTPIAVESSSHAVIEGMRATLKQGGVQIQVAPQLFPTSADVAEMVIDLAQLEDGHKVLEPSAGTGVLINAATASGADISVTAVEIHPGLCNLLRSQGKWVIEADFLSLDPEQVGKVDRVLMNPPFADASDIAHILHAMKFVRSGGLLVAICADGPRQNAKLRPLVEASGGAWIRLPAGSFKHAGTNVNTVMMSIHS